MNCPECGFNVWTRSIPAICCRCGYKDESMAKRALDQAKEMKARFDEEEARRLAEHPERCPVCDADYRYACWDNLTGKWLMTPHPERIAQAARSAQLSPDKDG